MPSPRLLSSLPAISSTDVLRPILLLREGFLKRMPKGTSKHYCSPKISRNIVESYLHDVILVPDNFLARTFGAYCRV